MTDPEYIDHEAIVARCLALLGWAWTPPRDFHLVAGGASGASTYRLEFATGVAFLKATLAESPPHLLAGARREAAFYRRLAPTLPIPLPRVIASRWNDVEGVALLLDACDRFPEPWTDARYLMVAEQLARFHATYWRKDRDLASSAWLRRHAITHDDIRRAHRRWERLRTDARYRHVLTPDRYTRTLRMLDDIQSDDPTIAAFPRTLVHGDFHIDNILMHGHDYADDCDSDGEMVVADWQEVGPGLGPEDLSFFLQRATFEGRSVPREAMIDAYRRRLCECTGDDIPVQAIRHVMGAAELRTRLLHWPDYVTDEGEMLDLLDRIDALVAILNDAPGTA